jgi:hypothetical protein
MSLILDGTNGLSDVDGSAATPAIRGSDANTGVFFGTDIVGVSTGGSERVRVDASGNVGIGTSSPARRLDVRGGTGMQVNEDGAGTKVITLRSDFAGVGPAVNVTTNDPLLLMTNNTERARFDSSGNLLVGTTSSTFSVSPSSTGLQVRSTGQIWPNTAYASQDNIVCATTGSVSGTHTFISFYAGGTSRGSINFNGSTLSYSTSSDYRLKENIQPMTSALATVAQLNPVTYTWKDGGFAGQGFIAHELQEVVPDAVIGEKDAVDADGNPQYQGIDTSFLAATLTAAIQELKGINDAQAQIITALTARVEALESQP